MTRSGNETSTAAPETDHGSGVVETAPRPKRRILFVDDEEAVLQGLRSVLRPQRHEWDMSFAIGGPAALAEVQQNAFDVVVTDRLVRLGANATQIEALRTHAKQQLAHTRELLKL